MGLGSNYAPHPLSPSRAPLDVHYVFASPFSAPHPDGSGHVPPELPETCILRGSLVVCYLMAPTLSDPSFYFQRDG